MPCCRGVHTGCGEPQQTSFSSFPAEGDCHDCNDAIEEMSYRRLSARVLGCDDNEHLVSKNGFACDSSSCTLQGSTVFRQELGAGGRVFGLPAGPHTLQLVLSIVPGARNSSGRLRGVWIQRSSVHGRGGALGGEILEVHHVHGPKNEQDKPERHLHRILAARPPHIDLVTLQETTGPPQRDQYDNTLF